ncbi:MAG: ATP-binding cassette domain-containing protein [Methylobacterium mesophilicum]|nr:ATP-binding cassette domain-containing protein [Methylobacterium mesophilicum]
MKRTDPLAETRAGFALDKLAFAVPGRALLHPLTLEFTCGRVTALLGKNGSGKSTLLKLLARQAEPSTGSVRLGDRALGDWSERDFARQVAYLPQETPSTTGLLVRELVSLGRYPWHGALGRFSDNDSQKVEDALVLADVAPLAEREVDTLSGGERQRVWIAMLVAQDARWLLLDEPISALDISHQLDVLGLLRRLVRERGLGVIVVLHEVNMAARFCDRVIALKDGRLAAANDMEDFMVPERLRDVYGVAMNVVRHPISGIPVALAE